MITWGGAAWARTTVYVLGQRVVNGANVYRCAQGGTSASSPATGPSGTGTGIADGSCTWDFAGVAGVCTVVAVAPELATIPVASQVALLDQAVGHVDAGEFGDDTDAAIAYLAAHTAVVSKSQGQGPIASESVGPLSRSYASLTSFGTLGLTTYGIQFLELLKRCPAALGAVP